MFLVFDIETVPDVGALARWLHLPPRSDPDAVMAAWREARPEAVMPKPPFQQVVAIAGAVIGEDGRLETLKA
ncbi:MAG: 3'-5' exonuclease, partial [Clostridia bacterium]